MTHFSIKKSQGNEATRLSCGGMFVDDFAADLFLRLTAEEFSRSICFLAKYRQEFSDTFVAQNEPYIPTFLAPCTTVH